VGASCLSKRAAGAGRGKVYGRSKQGHSRRESGADPEVKYLSNGTTVANFRIATADRVNKASGEKSTITEWHRVVAFGRLAEICESTSTRETGLHRGRIRSVPGKTKREQEVYDGDCRDADADARAAGLLLAPIRITPLIRRWVPSRLR